ncbi:MAG: sialidase family protein [Dysgonamonadaceae bacterium]|jgi:hypothetical protein|nr:sialidase family protein [Dysgonamonadaceae bacterium]MDD3309070.1 sialidase family protein [Dysgonamonadaceae bacterium]MDD3899874.1 sialidase family protein [Dysgonamonadaceae bacterium]MDD4398572.1 sialidase family protein [Dysgonamonadaceae bacterium]MEA5080920.1 sialidase family protein [Dysgonamonadaceae bacterium]
MNNQNINRRNFIKTASLITTGSLFSSGKLTSSEKIIPSNILKEDSVCVNNIENKIAIILKTKLVSKEPGKYFITERKIDQNGHQVASQEVLEPNRYLGWPTIGKTNNGELLIVYSGDRDSHVCPWGKTHMIRSKDNGETWSEPEEINNTPLDDRDAGIIQTSKNTILVSWFTSLAYASPTWKWAYQKYNRIAEKIPDALKKEWLGNWVRRSLDGGRTWEEPTRTLVTAPHGPIQLSDGRLFYLGTGSWNGIYSVVAEESRDDGISWKVISAVPPFEDKTAGFSEPHVVELKSGKLLAMIRYEPKDSSGSYLMQTESNDGGKNWTNPHKTPMWGYPPHLIELNNGWVLVVYGHRRDKYSERACISKDEGKTWDIENEIILAEAFNGDLGYPSSVQLEDDSILTVYYQQENKGEPTSIFMTHWKLKR